MAMLHFILNNLFAPALRQATGYKEIATENHVAIASLLTLLRLRSKVKSEAYCNISSIACTNHPAHVTAIHKLAIALLSKKSCSAS